MSNPMTKEEAAEFAKHFQVRTMDKDGYHGYYRNEPVQHRKWVGLTDEEIEASKPTRSNDAVVWELAVEWAETKLKEKNT